MDESMTTEQPRSPTPLRDVDRRPHDRDARRPQERSAAGASSTGSTLDFVDDAITTVLGPSGTGKCVLLKHIVGLLEPDAGEVKVFGSDIWEVSEEERYELRKRFGVLFQDGALFGSMNLYDNVAFPLRKHTDKSETEIRDIVMSHLSEVGLEAAIDKAPERDLRRHAQASRLRPGAGHAAGRRAVRRARLRPRPGAHQAAVPAHPEGAP